MLGRILIANSEQRILDLILHILTEDGYEVDTAINGEEALAKLADNLYSLVILGIPMPGKSGIEVYEQSRLHFQSSATKYMFMTSVSNYERNELRDSIFDTGVPCITMPFDVKQFATEVNQILRGEKMSWFKGLRKLLPGLGQGVFMGGGCLFQIVQFVVTAVAGLSMIWWAITLFIEGSILWGLLVLIIGTPIVIGLAGWAAIFFFPIGIITLIIWGIISLFGIDISFGSVWGMVWFGIKILILGGIAFTVGSSFVQTVKEREFISFFKKNWFWIILFFFLLWLFF